MNNIKCILLSLGLLSSLGGCVTNYVADMESAGAKLRYVTNTSIGTSLTRLDIESCKTTPRIQRVARTEPGLLWGNATEKSKLKMLGTSDEEEALIRERMIASNEAFIFSASIYTPAVEGTPGFACRVYGGFEPVRGLEYELLLSLDKNSCRVNVVTLSHSASGEIIRNPELTFVPYQVPRKFGGGSNPKGLCELALPHLLATRAK